MGWVEFENKDAPAPPSLPGVVRVTVPLISLPALVSVILVPDADRPPAASAIVWVTVLTPEFKVTRPVAATLPVGPSSMALLGEVTVRLPWMFEAAMTVV